jgi:choline dehydrogenase-like flavoprotein
MTSADYSAEYIVIGSGAGGGPLAANLALRGFKVLLLEAGGDVCETEDGRLRYEVPAFHANCSDYDKARWDFWVHHYSNENSEKRMRNYCDRNRGVWYPRAGALGGCTAHNAMITIVPQASDWDNIARLTGDESWRAQNMYKYWARLERCEYISRPGTIARLLYGLIWPLVALLAKRRDWRNWIDGHGFLGWLPTSRAQPELVLRDLSIVKILLNAFWIVSRLRIGAPFVGLANKFDINDQRNCQDGREGLWLTTMTTYRGRRQGPREFILEVACERPDNLRVKLNTFTTRIMFQGTRAVGVEALEGRALYEGSPLHSWEPKGTFRRFFASREVIVCAGAFNSPQLLKLSGIGPKDELDHWKIPIVVERRGVGENLQDRYEISVISKRAKPFALLRGVGFSPSKLEGDGQSRQDPVFRQWLEGKGLYCSNGSLITIFKRSGSSKSEPDLCILGFPGYFCGYYPGYSNDSERFRDKFSWVILKAYTKNTAGRVTLQSTFATEAPRIDFCYFHEGNDKEGKDLSAVVDGIRFVRKMNKMLGRHFQTEIVPGEEIVTDADVRRFIENTAWGHHASCTNKMGLESDCMSVVDSRFQVHGTQGLRVVDASIFPRIPGYFIVTAVYMISEKAADTVVEDALSGIVPINNDISLEFD